MAPLQFLSDVDPGRISFSSSEFLDESNFISICPNENADFVFLSGNLRQNMMSADELFRGGKLLPSSQTHPVADRMSLNSSAHNNDKKIEVSWFVDDDPSPRPPKCTILWKELLKLKKQRPPSTLSMSSSSSSSSTPLADVNVEEREKSAKRMKGRTKSTSIRIRPVLTVPICTQAKNNLLPPLFSLRKLRR